MSDQMSLNYSRDYIYLACAQISLQAEHLKHWLDEAAERGTKTSSASAEAFADAVIDRIHSSVRRIEASLQDYYRLLADAEERGR